MKRILPLVAIVLSVLLASSTASFAKPSTVRSIPPPDPVSSLSADALGVVNYYGGLALHEYLSGIQRADDERVAREAEEARQAALRAVQQPSVPSAPVTSNQGVGECTGFAIPDYIIQRESGGQPFIQNRSSDAFGCAQTLLRHYYGGACSGLDPYTIQGQRDCVWILSRGGTNLAPWAF